MVPVSKQWITSVLSQLRSNIAASNQRGNVEGLLSRHLLGNDPRLAVQWIVDCDDAWVAEVYDPGNLGHVAALAYTITHTGATTHRSQLEAGLQRAASRDPKSIAPAPALHDPAVLVGLCLGSALLKECSVQYSNWCATVLRNLEGSQVRRVDPIRAYAAQLCATTLGSVTIDLHAPLLHRAAVDWWFRRPANAAERTDALIGLRKTIVEEVLSEPLAQLPAHQAALLWRSLRDAVSEVAASALQTPQTIAHALRQFETSLRRWRWDPEDRKHPVRWKIRSEREVQDIVWLLLRPICLDLEDEDTLPKFGHSTYRADFGIPSLGLLIEVKFATDARDFKEIEKEALEDIVPYLRTPERYHEILFFIYDDSCSVQNHDTTIRALRSVPGVADVVIVCRPSHLPRAAEQFQ